MTYHIAETSPEECSESRSSPAVDVKDERELYSITFMDKNQIVFSPERNEEHGQIVLGEQMLWPLHIHDQTFCY